jgi:hypothetical protein
MHRERISCFLYGDIRGAKQASDVLCLLPDTVDGITGYIQEIKLTPFGFTLYSDIQVCTYVRFLVKYYCKSLLCHYYNL